MSQPNSRDTSDTRDYILQICLREVTDPPVTRKLSVPPSTNFHKLHHAIQLAFGWNNVHLYQFQVLNKPPMNYASTPRRYIPPKVLLRLPGPGMVNNLFGEDDIILKSPKTVQLREVFERAKYKNGYIEYLYDLGDNWEHSVTLTGRGEEPNPNNTIRCLSGEGGSVAEDCGGVGGWEGLKQSFKLRQELGETEMSSQEEELPEMSSQEEELDWYDDDFVCDGTLDPWHWDIDQVNKRLAEIVDEMKEEALYGLDSDGSPSDSYDADISG